jgi:hypothetical protein
MRSDYLKKYLVISLSILILISILFVGYSGIRTLNDNPLSMPKAQKIAKKYLNKAYPDNHFIINTGVYETTFSRYLFDIEDFNGSKVNQLILRKGLEKIEDTNLTKDLNAKVKSYISSKSNLSFKTIDVNGTVFFSTEKNFKRLDDLWIMLSGNELTTVKLGNFGKSIINWSKENGLSVNKLTIDYDNLTSHKSYRLAIDKNQLGEHDYAKLISITK